MLSLWYERLNDYIMATVETTKQIYGEDCFDNIDFSLIQQGGTEV